MWLTMQLRWWADLPDTNFTFNFFAACSSSCNEGQRRCVGADANQCCNWYVKNDEGKNVCVQTCPSGLVGDTTTYDCSKYAWSSGTVEWWWSMYIHHVGCPELSLTNGMVEYSPSRAVGGTATHSCNNGYRLSSSNTTKTCELRESSGWSGNDIVCNRKYLTLNHPRLLAS